jgi:hypothetical protein
MRARVDALTPVSVDTCFQFFERAVTVASSAL